jgi:hypothetical protein
MSLTLGHLASAVFPLANVEASTEHFRRFPRLAKTSPDFAF